MSNSIIPKKEEESSSPKEETFEDILQDTGGFGFYQKRFLFFILNIYYVMLPLSWLNEIFILNTPEHWCKHPSTEGLSPSELLRWKECYLTKTEDGRGFESCEISVPLTLDVDIFWNHSLRFENGLCPERFLIEPCKLGMSYDQSDFVRTIPTEYGWVCSKKGNIPLAFLAGVIGSIVGTSLYNYLGDVIGRKRMTFISVTNVLVFSVLKTLSAKHLYVYMAFKALASAAYSSAYQLPFAIIMEISTPKTRSYGIASTSLAWTLGVCILPLYAWTLNGDWFILSITSPLPLVLVYCFWNWIPESPRWLLTKKGDYQEAGRIMLQMARSNNISPPLDEKAFLERLKIFSENNKEQINNFIKEYCNLILTPGLRVKTLCLTLASIANFYIYYQIMINIQFNQMNIFLMFFALSIVEGPGYLLGQLFLELFGRRWTHVGFQAVNVINMLMIIAVQNTMEDPRIVVSVLCILAKLNSCAGYIVFEVQSTEIFPTPLRTTGIGFTCLIALIVGLSGPHVVYLGGSAPYIVMGGLCFIASIACIFIPETKGVTLPETLEQTSHFELTSKVRSKEVK
ncbi:SLC22A4_5 [Lepeophtheirus salmonis]|uniref:SLC22A4_5 n=1 Tax=Lepeophtheirus salmonis TaxID=72036 RepID=A0A0K2TY72_LEPSM|nr:SLC22A4_5 [Lepeophtheirus salmonis]CAF2994111.1 SLC22A4_5 [Lepeophtheirus salmonis]